MDALIRADEVEFGLCGQYLVSILFHIKISKLRSLFQIVTCFIPVVCSEKGL